MKRLVVVGNGMAGMNCLEQILKHEPRFQVTVFGDETHVNYNRIMLSSVLAGEKPADDIVINPVEWYQRNQIDLRVGVRVVDVNSEEKTVTDAEGCVTPYDTLLLATGSSAFLPPIEGLHRSGVLVFRTLDDTREMLRRAGPGVKAVVIGGGLLGLEAARGLQVQGCDVTVLHLASTLMERQLDPDGGQYLLGKIEELGVRVLLGRTTTAILGSNGHVEGVALSDDTMLEAELVVVAAGIRPNVDLAYKAGLHVNRGIVVNDYMETSDPDIFAVGECVEHRGVCYGLVAPLFEQGKVLAATMTGNRGPTYTGTVPAAKLKIMGVDVFSAGDWSEQNAEPVRFEDRALGIYKKLTVRDGKLVGVILVGDTSDSHRYMDWLRTDADISGQRRYLLFPPPTADAGLRRGLDGRQRHHLRLRRRHQGHHHRRHPRQGRQHDVAAQGVHACQHELRQLHRAVPGPAARGGAGVRGRSARRSSAAACRSPRTAARHPAQPEAEVGAGGARDLRQRHRLRGVQAGAQLHARHAVVRRSRRGPLGAVHQRSRARQHPEGRHLLGDPAHSRRRDQSRRAAAHRRRGGQVPACRW